MRTLSQIVESMSYVAENEKAEAKAFRQLYRELQTMVSKRKTKVIPLRMVKS